MIVLPDTKPHDRTFIRLDNTPERDEQTDRICRSVSVIWHRYTLKMHEILSVDSQENY